MLATRVCLMYDEVFYNIFPDPFDETPVIAEVDFGETLRTFNDETEAEAALMSAYARRIEYEENGLEIPPIFELIPLLEIVEIDEYCEELIDSMSLEVV